MPNLFWFLFGVPFVCCMTKSGNPGILFFDITGLRFAFCRYGIDRCNCRNLFLIPGHILYSANIGNCLQAYVPER